MKKRQQRLQEILHIRQQKAEDAARNWLKSRQQFVSGKARHDQLVGFRCDYEQQLQQLGNSGCNLGQIRNRIEFIGQLDTALGQLSHQLGQMAKQRNQLETIYLKAKADEEVVRSLLARMQIQENKRLQRQEQKESDEYAQKQWYINNSLTED